MLPNFWTSLKVFPYYHNKWEYIVLTLIEFMTNKRLGLFVKYRIKCFSHVFLYTIRILSIVFLLKVLLYLTTQVCCKNLNFFLFMYIQNEFDVFIIFFFFFSLAFLLLYLNVLKTIMPVEYLISYICICVCYSGFLN